MPLGVFGMVKLIVLAVRFGPSFASTQHSDSEEPTESNPGGVAQ